MRLIPRDQFGYFLEGTFHLCFTVHHSVQCIKLTVTNIFKAPEVPRKAIREEKIPVAIAKAPEPPAPRGT